VSGTTLACLILCKAAERGYVRLGLQPRGLLRHDAKPTVETRGARLGLGLQARGTVFGLEAAARR
jgi:hypothetical protein